MEAINAVCLIISGESGWRHHGRSLVLMVDVVNFLSARYTARVFIKESTVWRMIVVNGMNFAGRV